MTFPQVIDITQKGNVYFASLRTLFSNDCMLPVYGV